MKYVILGTAGHIDHGKSSLVQALTGVDPDRLKEEKERGITIDLGFADLAYPDGLTIGIVDVPGHERLVKNMLAGAGGIDIVAMVIAADEGIMPQSREHLHICNLLRIKSGIVVLTKADLVEPDWLAMVAEEAAKFVKGTFLEGAPIVPVSSKTGLNLDRLKATIHDVAEGVEPKPTKGLFRLPVDRVFTMKGFGTVITGTVVSGTVELEEQVEVLPGIIKTKVRGLQSHGKAVNKIFAGQRAAVNLQGIEKEQLKRGDTIVTAGRFTPTQTIDAKVEFLTEAQELKNRSLVHFHLGTAETVARIILYGMDKVGLGQSAYCQFRLQEPVVAQAGDRYIVRRFSPLETIGGGMVLDPTPPRRKIKDGTEDLAVYETGALAAVLSTKVRKAGLPGMPKPSLEGWIRREVPEVREATAKLIADKTLLRIEDTLIHKDALAEFSTRLVGLLKEFHKDNPLKKGMQKEEARAKFELEPRVFNAVIETVPEALAEKDLLMLKGFSAAISDEDRKVILAALEAKGFQPPTVAELAAELKLKEKQVADILRLMHKEGVAYKLNETMYIGAETEARLMGILKAHFASKTEMTVAEFRDMLGTTRKYALPLLEYLDSGKMTLRVGDIRKWLVK